MVATVTLSFLVGKDIESACQEALSIADKLGNIVDFRFNGVDISIAPGDDWLKKVAYYHKKLRAKDTPNDPA